MTPRSLAEHRAAIASGVGLMPALDVLVADAAGCMLVHDLVADASVPAVDVAACDGYAVAASDVAGASVPYPVTLPVSHDAGFDVRSSRRHVPGSAARVATGVPLPVGADAVVPTIHTDAGIARVRISMPAPVGHDVRAQGDEAAPGAVIVAAGTRLGARHIGAAAALGHARLLVRPRPRVVVIAVGTELAEPGGAGRPGSVPEASAHALVVAARAAGARAYRVGPVPDDRHQLRAVVEDQLVRADVLITTGGLSGAPHDCVADVLAEWGDYQLVDVALSPGHRHGWGALTVAGLERTIPVMSLPGAPASALVAFEAYVRPALRAMSGVDARERPVVNAVAMRAWTSRPGVADMIPVSLEGDAALGYRTQPWRDDARATMAALAASPGYVLLDPDTVAVNAGDTVAVHLWEG